MRQKLITVALILFAGIMTSCHNLTTDDPYVDEIKKAMNEVQNYYFFDSGGGGDVFVEGDGKPDRPSDRGEFGGTCVDYATEFCERYSGESYLVTSGDGSNIVWSKLEDVLTDGTINIRPSGMARYNPFSEGGFYEHDGSVKDHRMLIVKIDDRWTLEDDYKDVLHHGWNVAVTPDNRWFLVDTSNERQRVLKEVNAPNWAK